jgi:hypothetical protein
MLRALASIPVLIVAAFAILWWMPETRTLAWRISDENQPIELLTFLAFLAGGLLGLDLVRRLHAARVEWHAQAFYGLFALGMLLIGMEEISWGQWFFDFDTPESIRWRNRQGEMNLHNLGPLYGKSSVLRIVFALGGTLGFALRRKPLFRSIAPPRALLPWFAVIAVCAGLEAALDFNLVTWPEDAEMLLRNAMPEVTELLVGVAAFLYVAIQRRRLVSRFDDENCPEGPRSSHEI